MTTLSKPPVVVEVPVDAALRTSAPTPALHEMERDANAEAPPEIKRTVQFWALLGVVLPIIGVVTAAILLWGVAFNWVYLALFVAMYFITGMGITVGFHRLFTHKSFKTNRVGTFLYAVAGSMAAEGSILEWVALHRRHHQHSDDHNDPHSPHLHDGSAWGVIKGFLYAHAGWFLLRGEGDHADIPKYAPDLQDDPILRFVSRTWVMWVVLGIVIPGAIAGLITQSWVGFGLGCLWGGLVRLFMVHHVTWSINSVCHIWGARPYESHDHSRNNVVFGVLGFGEGWHNNHHAFPASARHGLEWWQFDISYIWIKLTSYLGLASDVRVPDKQRRESKRRKAA